jgi:Family of unknown function (DUF6069)
VGASADPLSVLIRRIVAWPPLEKALAWGPARRVQDWARIDFAPPHRQPSWWRVGAATLVALVLSLAADAALVAMGKAVFPSTKGFVHYQFHDYAKLTVIGVLIACAAWPVVTRICAAPRWLFFRLAIVVTLVLFIPDVWIWMNGQPARGVLVLMAMHVAIAAVTYYALVFLAPVRPLGRRLGAQAALETAERP